MITAEQREKRLTGIGGSDAGAICGLNPYKDAIEVWKEKTIKGYAKEKEEKERLANQNEIMPKDIGNFLEKSIIEMYEYRTGLETRENCSTIRSNEYDFLLTHIDAYVPGDRIVEAKFAGSRQAKKWEEEGTDDMPSEYLMQCCHQSIVTCCPKVDVPVLIGTGEFRIYQYNSNKELEKVYLEIAKNFWNHVIEKTMPESTDVKSLLEKSRINQYQDATNNQEAINLCNQIKSLQSELSSIQEKIDEAKKVLLKDFMEGFKSVITDQGKKVANITHVSRCDIDKKLLKQEMPSIYDKYINTTEYSMIRFY